MKINGVEFTPQEVECVRIALDAYEAENLDHAESIGDGADEHDTAARETYKNEANVAHSAREKFRKVTP